MKLCSKDLCLEATSTHLLSIYLKKKNLHKCFPLILCVLLFVKGYASKTGSEIDSCARSMEDVNGSKKDLSASAGEACTLKGNSANFQPYLCLSDLGI